MPGAMPKLAVVAALFLSALGLAACGESSEEKATKQACAGLKEISTEIAKIQSLPISTSFLTEATKSFETIGKSVEKVKEAVPKLPASHREEVEAANKAFATQVASITASVVTASKSSNLEAALKSAEPQIKSAVSNLSTGYKKAIEELKC
jgi:hypothetical protein